MRIVQMLPSLAYGDAIGNDTVALKKSLEEQGYDTAIYAKYSCDRRRYADLRQACIRLDTHHIGKWKTYQQCLD